MTPVPLPAIPGHPALPGHFPGRPIVPGVLLVEWARDIISRSIPGQLTGIPLVKFTSPATDVDTLTLTFDRIGDEVRFEIHAETRRVATGRLVFSEPI